MLPERVMEILAIDVGLVVITSWFLILFFMFREFRCVSQSVNRLSTHLGKDEYLPIYQQSLNDELNSVNKHTTTLNELMNVHEILENQLKLLHANSSSPDSDEKITQLESQLHKSRALIKKLKGELVTSKKRLEHTKSKLYSQYDHVESLQKEKEQFLIDAQQQKLDAEHNEALIAQAEKYKAQQQQLIEAASDYKSKLIMQGKELETLKQKNKKLTGNNKAPQSDVLKKKVVKLEQELNDANERSAHIIKEKDFIESKFLDSIKQLEEIQKK